LHLLPDDVNRLVKKNSTSSPVCAPTRNQKIHHARCQFHHERCIAFIKSSKRPSNSAGKKSAARANAANKHFLSLIEGSLKR